MVEVTPKLRQLFQSLAARQTRETDVTHLPVMGGTDKLTRRLRQIELEGGRPTSVCTSLRDLCEM